MRLIHAFRYLFLFLLLCCEIGPNFAVTPIQLPIFDLIYKKTNDFNESIIDTTIFYPEYDFIVIGSGSGEFQVT